MLQRLLRLYNKQHQSGKTPLEDFTTEALVGLFETDKKLLQTFCKDFLKLKTQNFKISSQRRYPLKNEPDCIIDIIIEGENEICFIENKVHSSEGYKQIPRYCMILDDYKNNQKYDTKMVYCTKFTEIKDEKRHNFQQRKWYEIANFLKEKNKEKQSELITIFLKFLEVHKMNSYIDLKFSKKDICALKEYDRLTEVMKQHIEWAENDFRSIFEDKKNNFQKGGFDFYWKRYNYKKINVISGLNYSEIIYEIKFDGKIGVNIFSENEYEKLKEYAQKNNLEYINGEYNKSICIYWVEDLLNFLNDEKGDEKINEWFKDKFEKVKEFIELTKEKIDWNI